jgi:hypothetical protein
MQDPRAIIVLPDLCSFALYRSLECLEQLSPRISSIMSNRLSGSVDPELSVEVSGTTQNQHCIVVWNLMHMCDGHTVTWYTYCCNLPTLFKLPLLPSVAL